MSRSQPNPTTTHPAPVAAVDDPTDQALVHQFIRVHGRRPLPGEVAGHQRAQAGLAWGVAARARRGVSRVIVRL